MGGTLRQTAVVGYLYTVWSCTVVIGVIKKLMANSWVGDTGRISGERKDEEQESVHRRDARRHRKETGWKRNNAM